MASFEYHQNMHDVQLKPRLLRSLTREHLPDENNLLPGPLELAKVVTAIKTHGLLSENAGDLVDQKLLDKWKSAVDAWVEQLFALISSKMPDKCWAGICLLGVTCQECSTARFLDSYPAWFQKLSPHIQQSSESQLVKVASCASLSDMFTRLSGILNVKKDGTSLAGKLAQPILKLLTDEASESVWEGAVDLFSTLVNSFPSSVHRHYESAEAVIVSKVMSGKCNANLSKKFAYCLALLPKARGDEDSWCLMMQKILIFINVQLNDAFQGLEEETKSSEAMRLLVQPGKEPPPLLGCQLSGGTSNVAAQTSEHLLFYRVSTLMQCCSMMLTIPYSVPVSVPVRPLLALVRRVLTVDGSSSQALLSFMTVTQQENICSELPVLHLYSLELLTATIKGTRSQLLPNAAEVIRLITEYFRRCMLPALRIKIYSIMKILLISMGVGMALYLAQETVNNAFVDLDPFSHGSTNASSNPLPKPATSALEQPGNKKRKHGTVTGSINDHHNGVGFELESPKPTTTISVQIAALEALEALLTVGGALRSESWRKNVDFLLVTVATNICEVGWASGERNSSVISGEARPTWADFQLAALRALLASLLSPARSRPQYLSRGLELYRRGKQETGTKLAEFCAHALLALEVLIHPRALPLADFSVGSNSNFDDGSNRKYPENPFSNAQKSNTSYSRGVLGIDEPDPDDDLYKSWLGNGEEVDTPVNNTVKNMEQRTGLSDPLAGKAVVNGPVSTVDIDERSSKKDTGSIAMESTSYADEFMISAERPQLASALNDVGTSDGVTVPTSHTSSSAIELTKRVADDVFRTTSENANIPSSVIRDAESAPGEGTMPRVNDAYFPDNHTLVSTTAGFDKGKQVMHEDDSDNDSIPDIIDADPDSD